MGPLSALPPAPGSANTRFSPGAWDHGNAPENVT
jgi:hypothetical protein